MLTVERTSLALECGEERKANSFLATKGKDALEGEIQLENGASIVDDG